MQIPLQIVFKGLPHSDALEALIRERVTKLELFSGNRMISCRVIVHEPNRRRQQGRLYAATIDVILPGAELAIGHSGNHGDDHAHEIAYVAIRDAFDAMERKIKDHRAIRRHDIKTHLEKPHAKVTRLFPQDGYGFITTPEGREIYFNINAIVSREEQERIEIGMFVHFTEVPGDNGPQASSVMVA